MAANNSSPKAHPTAGGAVLTAPRIVVLSLALIGFVAFCWRWFVTQNRYSSEFIQDWGHAYIVPLIVGYLIMRRWNEVIRTPVSTFWPGLLAFVVGLASYFFFVVGFPNHMSQGASLVLAVFGLALFAFGPAMMRILFLPIAFLIFGVTISEQIMIMVTFKLQNISAWGGYYFLVVLSPIFGFTVSLTGNNIEIVKNDGTSIPLGIAEACSGMRMVVAFVALAGSVALLSCHLWWQRTAVMLLAVPVAVVMNLVRIATLGLLSLIDPKLASGDAHIFVGTLLLVPALGLFMGAVWSLDKIWIPGEVAKPEPVGKGPVVLTDHEGWGLLRQPGAWVSLLTLAVSAAAVNAAIVFGGFVTIKLKIYPEDGRALMAIGPQMLDSWRAIGPDLRENSEVEETLGTKNYLTRRYSKITSDPRAPQKVLQLHVAYYTGSIDTVPHVPERCMVGAGWQIDTDPRTIALQLDRTRWVPDPRDPDAMSRGYLRMRTGAKSDVPGQPVNLPKGIADTRMQITRFIAPDGTKLYAGYFFVANGQIATTAFDVRRMAFDKSAKYAYYMKVQVSSVDVTSEEELASSSAELLNELLPELMRCVPDWLKVERGEYPKAPETGSGKVESGNQRAG